MEFLYKMVNNVFDEYIEKPINSFCSTLFICYMGILIIYKIIKKIWLLYIRRKMNLYPDVHDVFPSQQIEINTIIPLTREELEKQKLDILNKKEELRAQSEEKQIKDLINAKNKEIEILTLQVLKKISIAKLRGESRIIIPKDELHRDVKTELRKEYDVEKMPQDGCIACTKKVMYYIDFGIEEAGTILEKLAKK